MTTTTTIENRTGTMSASAIIGSRVTNPAGEDLGIPGARAQGEPSSGG